MSTKNNIKDSDGAETVSTIRDKHAIVPTDKAINNIILFCN